jgi:glycosyltransferase involved in cell wall biosynthesis
MRRLAFVVPGDIETRTGGSIYDTRIAGGLRALGWCVDLVPTDLAAIPDAGIALVDGLALLALDRDLERYADRLRLVPLIHLPLALEVGLDAAEAARREAIERRALAKARLVVATGRVTCEQLTQRGVERDRIALVEPGTDPAPIARGSRSDSVAIVAVGALTPGKGHERLLRALATLPAAARWTLTCAGSADRDPRTAARVRALVHDLGLGDRVAIAGELGDEALAALYDRSDLFALATLRETYGMAVAEAIARGLPVVSTTVGAIPDIVGDGGLLVAPDADEALAAALDRVIADAASREQLAMGARASRMRLHTWDESSRAMAAALTGLDHDDRIAR